MGMTPLCVAIYARVSSEQQATSNTIASQVAALEVRLTQDGLSLMPDGRFTDEGYSGATLIRPALERLRPATLIASTSTPPTDWPGATPIRCC
jgi:site-specific DNA recombinase